MARERRDHARTTLTQDVTVIEKSSRLPLGVVVNLSLGGMMVLSPRRLSEGQVVAVELASPDPLLGGLFPLSLEVECLWSEAQSSEHHWYGAAFTNLTPAQIVAIAQLFIALDGTPSVF